MLQKAFGECALSKTRAHEWYTNLKSNRAHPLQTPTEMRKKVKKMLLGNHIHLREIAGELGIVQGVSKKFYI